MDYSQFFKWEMDTKSFTIVRISENKGNIRNSIKNEAITYDQKLAAGS